MLIQKKKPNFHGSIQAGVGQNPWAPQASPVEPRSCCPLVTEAPTAHPQAVLTLTACDWGLSQTRPEFLVVRLLACALRPIDGQAHKLFPRVL